MTRRMTLGLLSLVGLLGAAVTGDAPAEDQHLIVHEWGTFTSVLGRDGTPVPWRPLVGSDDLPAFVYRFASGPQVLPPSRVDGKGRLTAVARLETPVVYFYADREATVSLRVRFPGGRITEWYPQAHPVEGGLAWNDVEVRPGAAETFPHGGAPSHYYAARATDAAPLAVPADSSAQDEKFFFYRGVGDMDLAVWAQVRGRRVSVQSLAPGEIPEVVLFENRDGAVGYSVGKLRSGRVELERPPGGEGLDALRVFLTSLLVRHGLYPREAEAMLATWDDPWFEEGLRLLYVLPRRLTDRVLPLVIDPRPKELVRVMVGRLELIAREDEARVRAELASLPLLPTDADRAEIQRRLGRFGEPLLRRVLASTHGPEDRARIEALLEQ